MERMQDLDPVETGEWVDSLRAVLHHEGSVRATYLLEMLAEEARRAGIVQPSTLNTAYVNTIPPEREERADKNRPNWAATLPASSQRRPSTISVSGIFGTRRRPIMGAI